jgi:hypothetical protein
MSPSSQQPESAPQKQPEQQVQQFARPDSASRLREQVVPNVKVEISCTNPAAELMLIDSAFRVRARGSSPLSAEVPSGIYALKAKVGLYISERLERLAPTSAPYIFQLDAPPIESPIPAFIQNTAPAMASAAMNASEDLPCGIYICVRDPSPLPQAEHAARFTDFKVIGPNGEAIEASPEASAPALGDINAYEVISTRVVLGRYTLRFGTGPDAGCISLPVAEGWCLAVFISTCWKRGQTGDGARVAIDDVAVLFKRLAVPTFITADDINTLEAVRLALSDGRGVVPRSTLQGMLSGKFEKPMLGIFAAHILLSRVKTALRVANRPAAIGPESDPSSGNVPHDVPSIDSPTSPDIEKDLALAKEVVRNITGLLGTSHPDVVALRWGYEKAANERALEGDVIAWVDILKAVQGPPLLVASWDFLVDCATNRQIANLAGMPVFEPAGNLALSGRLWLGYKPSAEAPLRPPATPVPAGKPSVRETDHAVPIKRYWLANAARTLVARVADSIAASAVGPHLGLLRVELDPQKIQTPADAAAAFQKIARKADWDLLSSLRKLPVDSLKAPVWSAIQKDLLDILARAVTKADALHAIDGNWMELFLKSRRVPMSVLAEALYGLDVAAVSSDYIRRFKEFLAKARSAS